MMPNKAERTTPVTMRVRIHLATDLDVLELSKTNLVKSEMETAAIMGRMIEITLKEICDYNLSAPADLVRQRILLFKSEILYRKERLKYHGLYKGETPSCDIRLSLETINLLADISAKLGIIISYISARLVERFVHDAHTLAKTNKISVYTILADKLNGQ